MKTPARRQVGGNVHGIDLRREERIDVALPVVFDAGGAGTTRNVSASGIYIETDDLVPLGSPVGLVIELTSDSHELLRVRCSANVLRVEETRGRRGIAAAIQWNT